MIVTKNDVDLLRYIHAFKVVNNQQINRDIYVNYHYNSVCNRVNRLEELGLLNSSRFKMLNDGKKIVSVTKVGFNKYLRNNEERNLQFKSDSIEHDIKLVDLKHILTKSRNFIDYITENQYQTWGPPDDNPCLQEMIKINPDAIAKINLNKGDIWANIEYEHVAKSNKRYFLIIRKIYNSFDIHLILYVCATKIIMDKIMNVERKIENISNRKIYYQTIQELEDAESIKFFNCDNKFIEFSKIASVNTVTK